SLSSRSPSSSSSASVSAARASASSSKRPPRICASSSSVLIPAASAKRRTSRSASSGIRSAYETVRYGSRVAADAVLARPRGLAAAAARYGLHGAALLVIPAAIVAALMLASLPRLAIDGIAGEKRAAEGASAAHRRALAILLTAVAARGYVYTGLVSFIPL